MPLEASRDTWDGEGQVDQPQIEILVLKTYYYCHIPDIAAAFVTFAMKNIHIYIV